MRGPLISLQVIQTRGSEIEALLQRLSDVDDAMSRRGFRAIPGSLQHGSLQHCRSSHQVAKPHAVTKAVGSSLEAKLRRQTARVGSLLSSRSAVSGVGDARSHTLSRHRDILTEYTQARAAATARYLAFTACSSCAFMCLFVFTATWGDEQVIKRSAPHRLLPQEFRRVKNNLIAQHEHNQLLGESAFLRNGGGALCGLSPTATETDPVIWYALLQGGLATVLGGRTSGAAPQAPLRSDMPRESIASREREQSFRRH